ncbi:acyltransferase [uncultured Bacteroides sp.]|uniref:acyltransferase n=1 Tax=uncultured Bacteroides sp. TaxID=162156 RepID=UPI00263730FB|nr:acyltransferase [uncultured Bacteroides sp.]
MIIRNSQCIHPKGNLYIDDCSRLLCINIYKSCLNKQVLYPNLTIGHNFHATRYLTIQCAGRITIGDDVLIASNVFIIDFNHGMNPLPKNYLLNELEVSEVEIGDGAWICNNVTILPGVHIGEKAIIGAGSVVTKDIPPYCLAVGNPAVPIKMFDKKDNVWRKYSLPKEKK